MRLPWRDMPAPGGPTILTSLTDRETGRLRELAAGSVVLEVGSAYGYSAIQMAEAGARLVVAVDPHAGENPGSLEGMQRNIALRELGEHVSVWRARSQSALPLLRDQSFDLVFIDGDHSEHGVWRDVTGAWRLLAPGGWLCCHDYGEDSCPGVKKALDGWAKPDEVVDTLWIRGRR